MTIEPSLSICRAGETVNTTLNIINQSLTDYERLLGKIPALAPGISQAADIITAGLQAKGRLLLCGNGGH